MLIAVNVTILDFYGGRIDFVGVIRGSTLRVPTDNDFIWIVYTTPSYANSNLMSTWSSNYGTPMILVLVENSRSPAVDIVSTSKTVIIYLTNQCLIR